MSTVPQATLVLGASDNPQRYSFLAVQSLLAHGHQVIALGRKPGMIGPQPILTELPADAAVDTLTLYIGPDHQGAVLPLCLQLRPRRVIFNPGTENPRLVSELAKLGISTIEGCTLVMLSTSQY